MGCLIVTSKNGNMPMKMCSVLGESRFGVGESVFVEVGGRETL